MIKRSLPTKTKVNNKTVFATIVTVIIITAAFVALSMLPTAKGLYATGSAPVPQKKICPVGDYYPKDGHFVYICEQEDKARYSCDSRLTDEDDYRCVDANGVTDSNQICCLEKAPACPTGLQRCGDYCCTQGQECESVCGVSFCTTPPPATNCPTQYPKLCGPADDADRNTCCKQEESCGWSKVGLLMCKAKVAVCVPPGDCDKPCGETDDGKKVCCSENQQCKVTNGIPTCMPKDPEVCNPETEDFCQGGGFQRCCPKGTCRYQPGDDSPYCDIR